MRRESNSNRSERNELARPNKRRATGWAGGTEEKCERVRDREEAEAGELRRQCAELVGENAEAIAKTRALPPMGLNARAADVWEPLFVLPDLRGAGIGRKKRGRRRWRCRERSKRTMRSGRYCWIAW